MDSLGVLLITANIGSLCEEPEEIEKNWVQEFYKTVQHRQSAFIALHMQEYGGKNYQENMGSAENFIRRLIHSEEMSQYDCVQAFIDKDFTKSESFTALASIYFIHSSLRNVKIYDFQEKNFVSISGHTMWMGSLEDCPTVHKERFPQDFWLEFAWTRKGFMKTRWLVNDRMFDLVNLHLFHDASNLVSSDCSPSVYSANRRRGLFHVLTRLRDDCNAPCFLFGDFNFRLDLKSFIQAQGWSSSDAGGTGGQTAVYEQDGEVQLIIKCKWFEHQNTKIFQDENVHMLLRFDHEPIPFLTELTEVQISFPPTYPFSENVTKPSEFMGTRCPAWCDRVFMSHTARALLQKRKDGETCVRYGRIGGDVCMGDHKPVFLYFEMETKIDQVKN
ncbi:inositol polyphosphate-5-phosphatase A-like [Bufo gargarizans]|uniref:inositol polyphosphate-5-phosphatase A-like n=1 Tax=Bufo gargarizans TaxID=30331 RepID=UPI001CF0F636|nr:inositol polyphosphate-5-phosphatase A-like [Bufo gargarizans]XP_044138894.1 inositol polyphosphate-5-phosphatase A-like [Bufo gargarizans]XP_044138895.1 inositol polyphosphate-5-phosphatase A-like [Bufo gargarizans]XP_044138896.1 inositol polyphosphate-5-phosphatase A-like [Bufo gargarizans]